MCQDTSPPVYEQTMQSKSEYITALESTRSHLVATREASNAATSIDNVRAHATELNDAFQAYETARLRYVDDLNEAGETEELSDIFRVADELKSELLEVKALLPRETAEIIVRSPSERSSAATSISSAAALRIKAQAQKARLQSELSNLERRFQLEEEERKASQRRQAHHIQEQLEAVISEINVYDEDDGAASFKSLPRAPIGEQPKPYANEPSKHSYNLRPRPSAAANTHPRSTTADAHSSLNQRSRTPTEQQQDMLQRVTPPTAVDNMQQRRGEAISPAHLSQVQPTPGADADGHMVITNKMADVEHKQTTRNNRAVSYHDYCPQYGYPNDAVNNVERMDANMSQRQYDAGADPRQFDCRQKPVNQRRERVLHSSEAMNQQQEMRREERTTQQYYTPTYGNANRHLYDNYSPAASHELQASPQRQSYELSAQLINALEAPRAQIISFNGDPLQYHRFMTSFKYSVEDKLVDPTARLNRLIQYCTGKALTVVQGCVVMEPERGYMTAIKLLRERFGTAIRVSQSWLSHILSQDKLKGNDGPGVQAYADVLRQCYHTLEAIGGMPELSSQQTIISVVSKLPEFLQNRWRGEVIRIQSHQGRLISFIDVVHFVEQAADELNLPGYQLTRRPQAESTEHRTSKRNAGTFQVTTETVDKCILCNQAHRLFSCNTFKGKTESERYEFVRKQRLCFNCLSPKHKSRDCKSKHTCKVCNKKHHSLLHSTERPQQGGNPRAASGPSATPAATLPQPPQPVAVSSNFVGKMTSRKISLPVCTVRVSPHRGGRTVLTYALLDPGSTATFCSQELVKTLGIKGKKTSLTLNTINKQEGIEEVEVVNLKVTDEAGVVAHTLDEVYTQQCLPVNEGNIVTEQDLKAYPHLARVPKTEVDLDKVSLLIGQDHAECLLPVEIVEGKAGEPYATRTKLGWTVHGPLLSSQQARAGQSAFTVGTCCEDLQEQLEKFWRLDSHHLYEEKKAPSILDKKVLETWDNTTNFTGKRFSMAIPFKKEKPEFPDATSMAMTRLNHLKRKLQRDPKLREQYVERMEHVITSGYAEKVPENEIARQDGKVWVIPHHAVINPNKDKIRIVYDCAAKHQGKSLNDHINQGPDQVQSLVGVLLRFRLGKVAVMADISEMYYQVEVKKDDQDVLRFLWWPQGELDQPPVLYRMTRHLFGGTWAPSCCTTALQYALRRSKTLTKIEQTNALQCFYVDDYLQASDDPHQALDDITRLQEALKEAGFELTKWISNHQQVIEAIPKDKQSPKVRALELGEEPQERALGVRWDVQRDELSYNVNVKLSKTTKRGILSTLSSIFDPLGLTSPFILQARFIMQDLCRKKVEWDEEIPETEAVRWRNWLSALPDIAQVSMPRCVRPSAQPQQWQLHHFCDASTQAYGVATYLLMKEEDNSVTTELMMAKARLAPIKVVSIPRLELLACTLAARQDDMMRRELSSRLTLKPSQLWTDSTIALQYIYGEDKRFHTFVANRLEVIRGHTEPAQWHHVESSQNPADDCSRGLQPHQLMTERWRHGPMFLRSNPTLEWPEFKTRTVNDNDPEVMKEKSVAAVQVESSNPIRTLIEHYSDWIKAKRGVAWVRLCYKVMAKQSQPKLHLEAEDIKGAEYLILRQAQLEVYKAELVEVDRNSKVSKNSTLFKLCPVLTHNLLSIGGRLDKAPMSERERHPIIVPGRHPIATLLIRHVHQKLGHAGREHVLAELRARYWIVGGRQAVRRELAQCVTCKRREAPVVTQQMADLPEDRVSPGGHPFQRTGVDLFGPFKVKCRRATAIRYACLFTCLATRAIHIEVVHNLTADSFLQALQRLTARRGKVEVLRSDNGRNFVRAEKEIQANLRAWSNTTRVNKRLADLEIKWIFNPPYASSHGGVWERQIRSVRRVLAGVCQEQPLTDEGLLTLLCTAESIVNSRPITTVSTDSKDYEPLTPNHLLIPQVKMHGGEHFYEPNTEGKLSRQQVQQVNYLADLFWRRWLKEYLPELQRRSKWTTKTRNLSRGDLVLVVEPNAPRSLWRMGRIVENINEDKRSARVRTAGGEIVRPIQKLCLLEAATRSKE